MVIHTPVVTSLSPAMLTVAIAALLALLRFRLSVIPTILGCSAVGVVMHLSGFA
jgi:chromate transporter